MTPYHRPGAARAAPPSKFLSRWTFLATFLVVFLSVTVHAQQTWPCPLRNVQRSVTICRPVAAVTYDSPIRVLAGSAHTQAVYRMQVYLDGVKVHEQSGDAADTNLIVTPGTHRLTVQAVDSMGTFKETIYVTIRNRNHPRFAYLANSDGTTSTFAVESGSGYLRQSGYVTSGDSPLGIAATWRGFVYVADNGDGKLYGYKRAQDGRLSPVPGSPFDCGGTCRDVTVDASGKFAYVIDGHYSNVHGYSINASTGALTALSGSPLPAGEAADSIVISSRGIVFVTNRASNDVSAFTTDTTSGALTPVPGSPFKAGTLPSAAAVDPFGTRLYIVNSISNDVTAYKISKSGTLSVFGGFIATDNEPVSIAMYPSGGFIYVANKASSTISVFKLDIDGAPKKVGTFTTAKNPSAVKVDVQGKFLLVVHSAAPYEMAVYKINLTTGALTYVRSVRTRPTGTALAVSYGPQPLGFDSGYVYVGTANRTTRTGKVFGFAIGSGGVLKSISGSPWSHPTGVVSLAAHPTGKMLYAPGFEPAQFQGLIGQYGVNLSTGALTDVGAYTQQPEVQSPNMVVDASGRFAYANSPMYDGIEQGFWGWALTSSFTLGNWLWYGGDDYERFVYLEPTGRFAYLGELVEKISPTTGELLYWMFETHDFDYMAAYPSGRYFFAIATGSNEVKSYTINASTGKLTQVGSAVGTGSSPVAITVDPYGNFVFVANKNSNNVSAYKVNRGNGTLTLIGTFSCGTAPVGVTTDTGGRYLFVVNSISLDVSAFEINQATGRLTAVVSSPFHLAASGEATSILNIGKVQ